MSTTVRRTSIYSLRFPTRHPEPALQRLIAGLHWTGAGQLDAHLRVEDGQPYATVGFRAAGDDAAVERARVVLDHAQLDYTRARLFTGFGMHRREVTF